MPHIDPNTWDSEHERRKRDKIVRNANNEKKTIKEKEKINGKKVNFIYIYICIMCWL